MIRTDLISQELAKELLIDGVKTIEQQSIKDKMFTTQLVALLGGSGDIPHYDNSLLINHILHNLQLIFVPKGGDCEIERFCFELEFGNAKGADLRTVEELWDRLIAIHAEDTMKDLIEKNSGSYVIRDTNKFWIDTMMEEVEENRKKELSKKLEEASKYHDMMLGAVREARVVGPYSMNVEDFIKGIEAEINTDHIQAVNEAVSSELNKLHASDSFYKEQKKRHEAYLKASEESKKKFIEWMKEGGYFDMKVPDSVETKAPNKEEAAFHKNRPRVENKSVESSMEEALLKKQNGLFANEHKESKQGACEGCVCGKASGKGIDSELEAEIENEMNKISVSLIDFMAKYPVKNLFIKDEGDSEVGKLHFGFDFIIDAEDRS